MNNGRKRLELTWIGKDERKSVEPRILLEVQSKSHLPRMQSQFSRNVLINADNLLALRALEGHFYGQIKCVIIDPPYNTGAAFQHYDDSVEHSLWLTLMRDRIEALARLISPDGSIWIAIDDIEAHYLKVLCDEVFGRSNFVGDVIWQKKYTVANDAKWFSDNHDHILVYAKNKETWRPGKIPRSKEMNARYTNPDGHPKGPWKATPLHAKSGSERARGFRYQFRNGVVWSPPPGTFPRFSKETLQKLDEANEIWFGNNGRSIPSRKTFLADLTHDGTPPLTVWLADQVGHNHEAKTEVKAFNPSEVFSTPKPERLLRRILSIATSPGDLVLDSFAGSGTTGAVAHKMGRRWIMIEQGEHCHTHIIPRMKKVIDGEDLGGITEAVGWQGGGGFRYFRLAPSLMAKDRWGKWVISRTYNPAMLAEAVCKLMGFTYAPSGTHYWMHGSSSERDFIYVTTQSLTTAQLRAISEEVGEERSLLICCKAFRANADAFANLFLRKIPQAVLDKCEWGKDDYSLAVASLSPDKDATAPPAAAPLPARRKKEMLGQTDLFAAEGE